MPPQFQNMNELTSYLSKMEDRVMMLETQNETLNRAISEMGGNADVAIPKTGLLSSSFMQRAFTVWGHYFVAQLIISIPLICIYFIALYVIISQGGSISSILPTQ
jgi:hypothetical protein